MKKIHKRAPSSFRGAGRGLRSIARARLARSLLGYETGEACRRPGPKAPCSVRTPLGGVMNTTRTLFVAIGTALAALAAPVSHGADSTNRSSMPDFCTQRDVNCVLPDGTRGGGGSPATPSVSDQSGQSQNVVTPTGTTSGGAASNTAVVMPPTDASGVTTVVTPPVGSAAGTTSSTTSGGTTGTTTSGATRGTAASGGTAGATTSSGNSTSANMPGGGARGTAGSGGSGFGGAR